MYKVKVFPPKKFVLICYDSHYLRGMLESEDNDRVSRVWYSLIVLFLGLRYNWRHLPENSANERTTAISNGLSIIAFYRVKLISLKISLVARTYLKDCLVSLKQNNISFIV